MNLFFFLMIDKNRRRIAGENFQSPVVDPYLSRKFLLKGLSSASSAILSKSKHQAQFERPLFAIQIDLLVATT